MGMNEVICMNRIQSLDKYRQLFVTERYLLRNNLKIWISKKCPVLYENIHKLKSGLNSQFVTKDTNIVIEGYPGSGNSFVAKFVKYRHKGSLKIADHIHLPAQIKQAVSLNKPVLLLVRYPDDAVLSYVAKQILAGRSKGDFHWLSDHDLIRRLRHSLVYYTSYHDQAKNFRNKIFLATFEEVVQDLSAILSSFNQRFNINLDDSPLTHKEQSRYFQGSKYDSDIEKERHYIKNYLKQLYKSTVLREEQESAYKVYRGILNNHEK